MRADEIDAVAAKREHAQREMERRIVAQLLTCMDDLAAPLPGAAGEGNVAADGAPPRPHRHVMVIGARSALSFPVRCRARHFC